MRLGTIEIHDCYRTLDVYEMQLNKQPKAMSLSSLQVLSNCV